EGVRTAEARAFGRALCRRCTGTPLQHLTGEQGFRRLVLAVRPGVFIPRPETEVLVDVAIAAIAAIAAPVVVDLCTGSGAGALAIADEHPGARVLAADTSGEAVTLAKEDAGRVGLDIEGLGRDPFGPVPAELRGWFDLVVATPPYLSAEVASTLSPEVRADPPEALFGDPELTRRVFTEAVGWLRPGGTVAVETDEGAAAAVSASAGAAGLADVRVRKDLAGRDRVVSARAR